MDAQVKNLEELIKYENSNGKITSKLLKYIQKYHYNFTTYSIFNSDAYKNDKEHIKTIIDLVNHQNKEELKKLPILERGSLGSMLGMAIADAMGHRHEFEDVRYNEITLTDMGYGPGGAFSLLPGQWTDDTSMGLCLADSLIMKKGDYDAHDLMHRFLCWWNYGYNNAFRHDNSHHHSVGLGGQISGSFWKYIQSPKEETENGDKFSSGIGSIMRNAAVPICYHNDINKAMEIAYRQSKLTHQGDEAAECCRLLTYIIVKIFKREKKEDENLKEFLDNNLKDFKILEKSEKYAKSVEYLASSKAENKKDSSEPDPDRNWNWKEKDYRYSPSRRKFQPGYIGSYAMDGMAMALHVVYYTNSFREAIIKVVNLRGDSDSVGAVVGQIAGAFYGIEDIPSDWIETVSKWDDMEIPLRGYVLQKLFPDKGGNKEDNQ